MKDFLQNTDGDVDFAQGLRHTLDLHTFVRQQLSQTLNFFQGEWYLDLRLGVPYFRDVLGARPDVPLVRALLRRVAERTRGVEHVIRFPVRYDAATRTIVVEDAVVQASDGAALQLSVPLILE